MHVNFQKRFQGLHGKYILQYFNGVSAKKSTILPQSKKISND